MASLPLLKPETGFNEYNAERARICAREVSALAGSKSFTGKDDVEDAGVHVPSPYRPLRPIAKNEELDIETPSKTLCPECCPTDTAFIQDPRVRRVVTARWLFWSGVLLLAAYIVCAAMAVGGHTAPAAIAVIAVSAVGAYVASVAAATHFAAGMERVSGCCAKLGV
jgi:hypothetical protein